MTNVTPDRYLDWAVGQLKDSGVEQHVSDAVMTLLTVFYAQEHDIGQRGQVLDLFDSLAHLHAVVVHATGPEVWAQARRGQVQTGDEIRVKNNAFDASSPHAIFHNGRHGRIIALRGGEIYVKYTDGKEPASPDVGLRFPPEMLEKRVR